MIVIWKLFLEDGKKKSEIEVLIFYVEFLELSHLTRDLSQAEKKVNAEEMHQMTSISLKMVEVVILSKNSFVTL